MGNYSVENTTFLQSLFDYNPDGVFSLNDKGYFTSVNDRACEISGYTREELLQMHYLEIAHQEEKEKMGMLFKNALKGTTNNFPTKIINKSGEIVHLQLKDIPIIFEGEIKGIYGIAKDVTARKRLEDELWETKEKLDSIINNSADAIIVYDIYDNILKVNKSFKTLFGWSEEEVIGKQAPFILEESKADHSAIVYHVKKGAHLTDYEANRIRKDGTIIPVSITLSPIRNTEGQIIAYSGISRDITERKRAEVELRESEEKYKQSEEKYRLIAEHTTDLIAVIDLTGKILYASPSHKRVLGSESAKLIQKCSFGFTHPDDLGHLSNCIEEMVENKSPQQLEIRIRHHEGHYLTFEAHGMPVLDKNGEIQSIVIVSRDITERKRTDALLRRSDKLTVLGELAAGIAHEIRNPLTSLKGFTQILKSSVPEGKQYFDIMLSELDRINSIVSEFMLLAKPQVMNFKKQNVHEIIEKVISLLEAQANLHNIQIIINPIGVQPPVNGAQDQLKQVFINILKNAIEAMPKGGTIFINVAQKDDMLSISFIDQGIGIPEERLKSIGEPFYTTKEKGTGLGMMICHKIIENHSGVINIKSKVNIGTIVEISLPINK